MPILFKVTNLFSMCFSPITIRNPRTFYRQGIDKLMLQVRCGKCIECRNELENDWFVRLAYEYHDCKSKGGAVYFPTLTYNPDSVPVLDTTSDEFKVLNDVTGVYVPGVTPSVPQFRMQGFNKLEVRKFFKSLRQFAHSSSLPKSLRLGISEGIKYFCVSEFGGEKHRPHYHIDLFLPKKVDTFVLKKVLELAWSDRISYASAPVYIRTLCEKMSFVRERLARGEMYEFERYFVLPPRRGQYVPQVFHRKGFVSWSKKYGAEVKSIGNIRYILKYLFKDSEFMSRPLVSIVDDYLKDLPPIKNIHNDAQLECIRKLKDFFPFRLSSSKLGDALFRQLNLADLDAEESEQALHSLLDNQVSVPTDTTLYSVPQYIIRRLFYNHRDIGQKKNVCQLNAVGSQVLKMKYNYTVGYLERRYRFMLEPSFVSKVDPEFYDEFKFKFGTSYEEFRVFCNEKFCGLFESFRDLAIYSLVYSFVSYENIDVYDYTVKDLSKRAVLIFNQKIDTYNNKDEDYYYNIPDSLNKLDTAVYHRLCKYMYNDLPQYDRYQYVIDVFNFLEQRVMYRVISDKNEQKAYRDSMHQLYTNFMYP